MKKIKCIVVHGEELNSVQEFDSDEEIKGFMKGVMHGAGMYAGDECQVFEADDIGYTESEEIDELIQRHLIDQES